MPARKIVSDGQWKLLLDYMEANPVFAKGIAGIAGGQVAKEENNTRWKRLAFKLNNVGTGCLKNYIQWRDYWNHTKCAVRKKACTIRKNMKSATDDESQQFNLLTKNEKRVLTSLGIPIPVQVRMKIKSPPVSPPPDVSPSSSPSQQDTSPPANEFPETPPLQIKSEPGSDCLDSPFFEIPVISKSASATAEQKVAPDQFSTTRVYSAPYGSTAKKTHRPAELSASEWVRHIEERRIAVEERSARALQGIQANTELCVNALQGIQFAQEQLHKTMEGILAALEASARALQERHS